MKKILITLVTGLMALQAQAKLNETTVISEREETIQVDVSTARVKLSEADYPTPIVKVLAPQLADVTLLDHRNSGEGAPCMATYSTLNPKDVIQGHPGVETVKLKITLSKTAQLSLQENLCEIVLSEDITTNIRGFAFLHSKQKVIATRAVEDCR